jgi:hypothetical protein
MWIDQAMFADGFLRLCEAQGKFVTDELTQTYWETLHVLNPAQWTHAVRVAREDPDPPDPGQLWPPGKLLAWGRSYLDPTVRALPEPTERATEDSRFPRRPGETALEYVKRYAAHLHETGEIRTMPEARMPYKEFEERIPGEDG